MPTNHPPFASVIFDLDGTLLDTLEDIAACTNRFLESRGYPTHPSPDYRRLIGHGAAFLMRNALPPAHRDDAEIAAAVDFYLREYAAGGTPHTHPFDGIPELLDALVARRLPLAILSNKPEPLTIDSVRHFLARWPWAAVCGARPGQPVKPDPAMPRRITDALSLAPASVAYLGDTDVDMLTARNAGMHPIGVTWGLRTAEELTAAGAQSLVHHPREVLPLLT